MVDPKQLKELRRLTNAGLADCKQALEAANGDLFTAAISMLTEADALEIQQSVHVRAMAGTAIKNPVTQEEQDFTDRLVTHFIAQRTRPLNYEFRGALADLFLHNDEFREYAINHPAGTMRRLWEKLQTGYDPQHHPTAQTVTTRKCVSTVVTMPPPQSEWECDFIVLEHPRRRLLFSKPPRVLAIYKRTKRNDHGLIYIDELTISKETTVHSHRWLLENANLALESLAQIGYARDRQEIR
ncbi:hypothetical protein DTL42_20865 [Bremerella cremea]|uniref:Elongation factor Ts n=1 Tax=Bremerella cremea TaxID=1031537 RepID=A0A368KM03_9BACT|nr:hypothetical protein [Bremerella cremea]RCS41045.1 hypothetical protein DTL42_20865 [Bremerella cremea]